MTRALMALVLVVLGAAASVRAQDAGATEPASPGLAMQDDKSAASKLQEFFASLEAPIRVEYRVMLAEIARDEIFPAVGEEEATRRRERIAKAQHAVKEFLYNRAVLTAGCVAEAEGVHAPTAPPVPATQNLMLRTCMETRLDLLRRFANTSSYAARFFPERLAPCERRARLPEQEKRFPPYAFLELDEPKLYDFELYNKCLMSMP
jgi:hypothetical protein